MDIVGSNVGIGATTPSARLHVKGSGTTSATTALLVENSAGTNMLTTYDNGVTAIGPHSDHLYHKLELKGETNTSSQTLLRLQSYTNWTDAYIGMAFTNSSNGASLSTEIRSYRRTVGNDLVFVNNGVANMSITNNGNVGIGEATPTSKLHVKGSGTTSATTNLLLQNSSGTDLLKVTDDGRMDRTVNGNNSNMGNWTNTEANGWAAVTYINDLGSNFVFGVGGSTSSNQANTAYAFARGASTDFVFGTNNIERLRILASNGNVGIGVSTIDASAKLQVDSTTKGLLPPRMTTTAKNAISSPANGLIVYDTTTNKHCGYNGTIWNDLY